MASLTLKQTHACVIQTAAKLRDQSLVGEVGELVTKCEWSEQAGDGGGRNSLLVLTANIASRCLRRILGRLRFGLAWLRDGWAVVVLSTYSWRVARAGRRQALTRRALVRRTRRRVRVRRRWRPAWRCR